MLLTSRVLVPLPYISRSVLFNIKEKSAKKVANKLHRPFGHPSITRILNMLKSAEMLTPEIESELHKVSEQCKVCTKYKQPTPRPVVRLPLAERFNDVVAMDLKQWENCYFLVMVNLGTRFCSAVIINNKRSDAILCGFLKA